MVCTIKSFEENVAEPNISDVSLNAGLIRVQDQAQNMREPVQEMSLDEDDVMIALAVLILENFYSFVLDAEVAVEFKG